MWEWFFEWLFTSCKWKAFDASCWWCMWWFQRCLESRGCGFDYLSLGVGQGFRRLEFLGIILLPISTNLFDYYAMGIVESGGFEVFNDLEQFFRRFLVLMFSSGESIVDKAQETSLEGSI